MRWRIKIFSPFLGTLVGTDQWGNRYYQSNMSSGFWSQFLQIVLGKRNTEPRRWVVYKGLAEPTKVPPQWHGWLHGAEKDPPQGNDPLYPWQKEPLPNVTGTAYAHKPSHDKKSKGQKEGTYEPWDPTQTEHKK